LGEDTNDGSLFGVILGQNEGQEDRNDDNFHKWEIIDKLSS
jgi:hypothetical protein